MKTNNKSYRTILEISRHEWFLPFNGYLRTYRVYGQLQLLPTITIYPQGKFSLDFLCWGITNTLPF